MNVFELGFMAPHGANPNHPKPLVRRLPCPSLMYHASELLEPPGYQGLVFDPVDLESELVSELAGKMVLVLGKIFSRTSPTSRN